MTRLLLVSGRYLLENPYRELRLKTLFEERGIDVLFALASRHLNANGYTEDVKDDDVFSRAGALWLNDKMDYDDHLKKCDAVLFGSWKSYRPLVEMARAAGKPTLNFNSTSGLDHWPHGVDRAYVKGPFSKRQMLYLQEQLPDYGNLDKEDIIITGSIIHEHYQPENAELLATLDHDGFVERYKLDPSRPTVVLFPKGIGSLRSKVPRWFPKWPKERQDAYSQWFLDKYAQICQAVKAAECNLIVKMHPTAYVSYMTQANVEYGFWQQFPWVKVLAPEHTHACYAFSDCGVGINTHSALDMGFFGKPFIYVDSDQIEQPSATQFNVNHLCSIPLGPSSHWMGVPRETVNPWFPSWLGDFCSIQDLPYVLNDRIKNPISSEEMLRFINEFWYKADGNSGERIVDFVTDYIRSWSFSKYMSRAMHYRLNSALENSRRLYAAVKYKVSKAF